MQVDFFNKVVDNIKNLIYLRDKIKANTIIRLSFIASILNIADLPDLIELGYQLGVDEIKMDYCKFYSKKINFTLNNHSPGFNLKYSLYYYKEYLNKIINKSIKIANKNNIKFIHEPLFNSKSVQSPCIYPCEAAEIKFYNAIKKGSIYFGNLLNEYI